MHARSISARKVRQYSDLVRSAARLGIDIDDLISETRKFHGIEFGDRVEKMVKGMTDSI
jgi:hypothetical protein